MLPETELAYPVYGGPDDGDCWPAPTWSGGVTIEADGGCLWHDYTWWAMEQEWHYAGARKQDVLERLHQEQEFRDGV